MNLQIKTWHPVFVALNPIALFILAILLSSEPVTVFMPLVMAQYAFISILFAISQLKLIGDIKRRYPVFDATFIGPFTIRRFLKQVDDPTFNDRYLVNKLHVRAVFVNFVLGVVLGFSAAFTS